METYLDGWRRAFSFKGESTRAQFWTFNILNVILIYALYIAMFAVLIAAEGKFAGVLSIIMVIYAFFYFFASWTIAVRRLHDSGKSGWCLLLGVIPVVGWLILLVFFLLPSKY